MKKPIDNMQSQTDQAPVGGFFVAREPCRQESNMKLAAYIEPNVAIRDNGPRAGLVIAEIDLGDLAPEQRRVLAALNYNRSLDIPSDAGFVSAFDRGILDHDNLVVFLDNLLAKEEEKNARQRQEIDEAVARARAMVLAGEIPDLFGTGERSSEIKSMPEYQRLVAAAERRAAEKDAREKAVRQAAEAAKAAARAEMESWIGAHGSERLRRCLKEGIACAGIYRDERLAADRPGWEWDTEGKNVNPINPPVEAFAMLDEARKTAPDAKLTLLEIEEQTDDETGEVTTEASQFYAAIADFLGRGIIYGKRIPRE
jgi:hypothetical protein